MVVALEQELVVGLDLGLDAGIVYAGVGRKLFFLVHSVSQVVAEIFGHVDAVVKFASGFLR